jgi:hypothetical protein
MHANKRLLLVLLAVLGLLPACGGNGDPADEGVSIAVQLPPVPPCELVSREEITGILGLEPGQPVDPGPQGPMFQCIWESPGESTDPYLHLVILPAPADDLETFLDQARESIGAEAEAWTLEPVEAIGDFAVTMGPENYSVLQVVADGRLLQIKTVAGNERTALDNARLLARLALPRLTGKSLSERSSTAEGSPASDETSNGPPH